MIAGVPVLAANSGGPLETVIDAETGWLRSVDKIDQWTEIMQQVINGLSDSQLKQLGENGKMRVREEFSDTKMARRLDDEFEAMVKARRVEATELGDVMIGIPIVICCLWAIGAVIKAGLASEKLQSFEIFLGTAITVVASAGVVGICYKLTQNESAMR